MPETVCIDFSDDNVMWVASKLSGAAGALGAEAIELVNWRLCFVCALEDLRVFILNLVDWMANPPPTLVFLMCSDGMSPCCTG